MTRAEDFLPLTPLSFHVLVALRGGPRHGYAIGSSIEETSHGALSPTTGSLYQALRRLREEGLIESAAAPEGEHSGGPPRLYFRLSVLGRRVAGLEAARLERLVGLAREAEILP
jgi:DNA-binding PadR family transcriptional regulator